MKFHVTVCDEAREDQPEFTYEIADATVTQARKTALSLAVHEHGSGDWRVHRVTDDGGRFGGLEDRDVSVLMTALDHALASGDIDFHAAGLHNCAVRVLADLDRENTARLMAARRDAVGA